MMSPRKPECIEELGTLLSGINEIEESIGLRCYHENIVRDLGNEEVIICLISHGVYMAVLREYLFEWLD